MRGIVIAILMFINVGCAGFANVNNKIEAQLMPEVIAKKVLIKYFGERWVYNPHGFHNPWGFENLAYCDGSEKELPFREITAMGVQEDGKIVVLQNDVGVGAFFSTLARQCTIRGIVFRYSNQLTEQDLDDIVDALVSLGAKIDEVKRE
jgi:hypothetical protein